MYICVYICTYPIIHIVSETISLPKRFSPPQIIENIIPVTAIIVCVVILLYCHCQQSSEEEDQIRTPLWLGVNYLCFNVPATIYWFIVFSSDSDTGQFHKLKLNYLIRSWVDLLAEQSNFLVLPIVFATSPVFRSTTQKFLQKMSKRIRGVVKPDPVVVMVIPSIDIMDHSETVLPLVNEVNEC